MEIDVNKGENDEPIENIGDNTQSECAKKNTLEMKYSNLCCS